MVSFVAADSQLLLVFQFLVNFYYFCFFMFRILQICTSTSRKLNAQNEYPVSRSKYIVPLEKDLQVEYDYVMVWRDTGTIF